jgi:ribosome-associated protein
MIQVSENISLSDDEIDEQFIRTSGPGGQHVNKTSSGVQLRFDVAGSPSLPEDVRRRLTALAGHRLTNDGVLVIEATSKRSQAANRKDATDRLVALILEAEKKPKRRRKTRPSAASNAKRVENKKRRSEVKRTRRPVRRTDD